MTSFVGSYDIHSWDIVNTVWLDYCASTHILENFSLSKNKTGSRLHLGSKAETISIVLLGLLEFHGRAAF